MNTTPLRCKVVLANPNGLHLRPSMAVVKLAEQFASTILVSHAGRSVNGKSIWDLITLEALGGSELTLEADGPDAQQALDALVVLLSTPPPPEN